MQAPLAFLLLLSASWLRAEPPKVIEPEVFIPTESVKVPLPVPKPVDPALIERNQKRLTELQDRAQKLTAEQFFNGARRPETVPGTVSAGASQSAKTVPGTVSQQGRLQLGPPSGRIEALLDGLDHYQATQGVRQFLKDAGITYDMKRISGVGAVYVTEDDEIVIEEDHRYGSVATTLPTFYHESGHAQWQHMGLSAGVVENEQRSWSIANHLAYEMFKDGTYQREFKARLGQFEPHIKSLEGSRKRVEAAASSAWPVRLWVGLEEWAMSSVDKNRIRDEKDKHPEVFGFIAEASSYQEFCKGQESFFEFVGKSYKHDNSIAQNRLDLDQELKASGKKRTEKALVMPWKGRYLLLMPLQRSRILQNGVVYRTMGMPETRGKKVGNVVYDPNYVPLKVEVADNEARMRELLRHRDSFYFYDGILLDYGADAKRQFSMEDLWMTVDIVSIADGGRIESSISGISADPHQVRDAAAIFSDMAKLNKTEAYWKKWRAEDAKWREDHPDYCSHPDIKKVFEWRQRLEDGMHQ